MSTHRGRRIALASVAGVVALSGAMVWAGWAHIRFALAFAPLGTNAQGFAEYRHRPTGIVFVSLPGGTFLMGSPEDEEGRRPNEGPVHEVTLGPFLVAKHEVTQAQWRAVMGSNRSRTRGDELPVESVSWEDCREFCARTWLALPSEAQWEYACRGGVSRTHPVGTTSPNGFGLHDMHGNVSEWCEDTWDEEFYEKPAASRTNPVCTSGSAYRVVRGGSYCFDGRWARSACRDSYLPSGRVSYIGIRPAARLP